MQNLQATLATPILKDSAGNTVISVMHAAVAAVGAVGLYLAIPSRKRKNLFK